MTILREAAACTIAVAIMLVVAAHTHIPELFQIIPLLTPAKAIWFWKEFGPPLTSDAAGAQ
jgi:hypothetical protein